MLAETRFDAIQNGELCFEMQVILGRVLGTLYTEFMGYLRPYTGLFVMSR